MFERFHRHDFRVYRFLVRQPALVCVLRDIEILRQHRRQEFRVPLGSLDVGPQRLNALDLAEAGVRLLPAFGIRPFFTAVQLIQERQQGVIMISLVPHGDMCRIFVSVIKKGLPQEAVRADHPVQGLFALRLGLDQYII